jgi:hypothetical protein
MRPSGTALLFLAFVAAPAGAQQATATLNANFPPTVRLSLSTSSITFADADPDVVPLVAASPPAITVTAKARAASGGTVVLTVEASDDLRSGLDTIPVSNITWTAAGPGFVAGTLSRGAPQVLGTWSASGVHVGQQSFSFANRWTYATGTYTVAIVYTLSAP